LLDSFVFPTVFDFLVFSFVYCSISSAFFFSFADFSVQCAGHVAGGSSVSTSAALARRRCEIRMGKRPILSDGMFFTLLYSIYYYAVFGLM
jgi:hypothetical protein